eukprot:GHVT01005354.1.p1 GENE.GHVT01005354.1~~GHVT01005354.1.p1  ORF type:complete len:166 (-),score=27.37 GHVT01005354.1:35-487(-)
MALMLVRCARLAIATQQPKPAVPPTKLIAQSTEPLIKLANLYLENRNEYSVEDAEPHLAMAALHQLISNLPAEAKQIEAARRVFTRHLPADDLRILELDERLDALTRASFEESQACQAVQVHRKLLRHRLRAAMEERRRQRQGCWNPVAG